MLILFVVARGCGLAPTVFSRIIICSMCVGVCWRMYVCVCCALAIYGLRLFACCAGIALARATLLLPASEFYVLACFTFQLASFARTEKLFNMPRTAMVMATTVRASGRAMQHTKVCQRITCCFYGIRHTHTHTHRYVLGLYTLALSHRHRLD